MRYQRYQYVGWVCFLCLIAGLRFVHLEADFPTELTWSGLLYTDEGWYARNAIAYELTGEWYVPGDFNPAINTPLFFLFQLVSFTLFGLHLSSARLTVVFFSILMFPLMYSLVRRHISRRAALISLLLLATNYTWFAFSRLAILEIPMIFFIVLGVYFALRPGQKHAALWPVLSAIAFAAALLVKASALFAFPLLLGALLVGRGEWGKQRLMDTGLFLFVLGAIGLIYWFLFARPYYEDFHYFMKLNVVSRLQFSFSRAIDSLIKSLYFGKYLGWIFYPLAMAFGGLFFLFSPQFRRNPLILLMIGWIAVMVAMIAMNQYFPPRYYLPMMIPVTILLSWIADYFLEKAPRRAPAVLFLAFMAACIAVNSFWIVRYLSGPSYSFMEMAKDIRAFVDKQENSNEVILGRQADQIALATRLFPITDEMGTQTLEWKVERYRPSYYVRWETSVACLPVLRGYYEMDLVETYPVLNNYYEGNPLHFYTLVPKQTEPN